MNSLRGDYSTQGEYYNDEMLLSEYPSNNETSYFNNE
jgi:hypothetical protein